MIIIAVLLGFIAGIATMAAFLFAIEKLDEACIDADDFGDVLR